MKIINNITQEEMQEKHPGLMSALFASPEDAGYCNSCDGLRLKKDNKCAACGEPMFIHPPSNP